MHGEKNVRQHLKCGVFRRLAGGEEGDQHLSHHRTARIDAVGIVLDSLVERPVQDHADGWRRGGCRSDPRKLARPEARARTARLSSRHYGCFSRHGRKSQRAAKTASTATAITAPVVSLFVTTPATT